MLDAAGDRERVRALQLLDDEQQARAVVDDRVADERLRPVGDAGHVAQPQRGPPRRASGTCARSLGWTMGRPVRAVMRCEGVSTNPPVPTTWPSENCSSPVSSALDVVSIRSSSAMRSVRRRDGSTSTWTCLRRSPQIATFATPGTRSIRARIFQYAVMDRSMRDIDFEDRPTFMIRLVDETRLHEERRRRPRRQRRGHRLQVLLDELARLQEVGARA